MHAVHCACIVSALAIAAIVLVTYVSTTTTRAFASTYTKAPIPEVNGDYWKSCKTKSCSLKTNARTNARCMTCECWSSKEKRWFRSSLNIDEDKCKDGKAYVINSEGYLVWDPNQCDGYTNPAPEFDTSCL